LLFELNQSVVYFAHSMISFMEVMCLIIFSAFVTTQNTKTGDS
jgi:hypothetical protein